MASGGDALGQLPQTYADALRLETAGEALDLIAQRLGVEPAAVAPLLLLAHEKLAAIEQAHGAGPAAPIKD
ncbi:MAG TPA: hypothetical protein VGI86_20735 [Acidimicrobiia bacterium]